VCGRYSIVKSQGEIEGAFDVLLSDFDWTSSLGRHNVAPTQEALVVTEEKTGVKRERRGRLFAWGLVPVWDEKRRLINVRDDTLRNKRTFRRNLLHGRCAVVADGFYEWKKTRAGRKVPMYIRLKSGLPFAFAGLWSRGGADLYGAPSFAIVTTGPNKVVESIHDRMPVMLAPEAVEVWLDRSIEDDSDVGRLLSLLAPFPSAEMEAYQVSTLVNSAANDVPECIAPMDGGQPELL
jgi:putative SOS response-associated peptidase YedK